MNNPSLPSGTVTFLFTDIEGSTKLAQQYPDKWESLRARHHAILQSAMDVHNGYVFQIIGDAFCVALSTAKEGLNAAIDSQRSLQLEDWDGTPVKVRMGIHTGEAELQATGDYRGYLAMSRVQRLMSAGHGGQVLISLATQELLRDDLPDGISLHDLGERRLKDLIRPERIFQLIAPDLHSEFAPLTTIDAFLNNLPVQLTSFIGREKEVEQIKKRLEKNRLVTLTGSGGTGKTRLSLQVAADLLDRFDHGVWFIELAPLADPGLIPHTLLSTIGISEQPNKTPLEILKEYLHEKQALIMLDNCEHLIEASAQVTNALLNAAPKLKFLASSREALGVKGEASYPVPSLSLPDPKHLPVIEQLSQYEAVRLFIDRALLVAPRFVVDKDNAPFIAQICYRLDGIPLAIELAAARVKMMSVEQISARLDDRFRLLTGGARTALPRQQTLRALIDWSYNLLSEDEKILFRKLTVFVGGWTLEAAEQVCIEEKDGFDIVELLTHLIDKSLVNVDHEQDNEARYYFLETIRQYAHEKLVESAEGNLIGKRHFDFFLTFAESAEPRLKSAESLLWLKKTELEHNNLRAALEWSLNTKADSGLRLVGALFWFWYVRGYWREGSKWAEETLAHCGVQAQPAFRAQALFVLGGMHWLLSDYSASRTALNESFELSQAVGQKWWAALTLLWLGWVNDYTSDFSAARSFLEEALALARELKDDWMTADVLRSLAGVIRRSDVSAARLLLEESLTLARKVGDAWLLAWELISLGGAAEMQGQHEQAVAFYEESAIWCRKIEDKGALAQALEALSIVLLSQGNIEKAEVKLLESLALAIEVGSYESIGVDLAALGGVAAGRGHAKRAAHLLAAGESILNAHNLSVSVWPNDFAAYNRSIASVRTQLDEATFNIAWEEGSKMTMEQAIEYALKKSND